MSVWFITEGPTTGPHTLEGERAYQTADNLFRGAVISVLGENLVDAYMHIPSGKELWDTLEAKFGASDAGSELYIMEQFYDYRMVDDRSVVEQAHELQALAKELDNFKCNLPEKFVAGGIIAKLPPSWRNFATSLKHKRWFGHIQRRPPEAPVRNGVLERVDNVKRGRGRPKLSRLRETLRIGISLKR